MGDGGGGEGKVEGENEGERETLCNARKNLYEGSGINFLPIQIQRVINSYAVVTNNQGQTAGRSTHTLCLRSI